MKKFKKENYKVPVYSWCADIEDGAMEQVGNLARLPFADKHIVALPDMHCGYGMPIGSVLAVKSVIVPNAIGKDISCGVSVIKTNIQEMQKNDLKNVFSEIRKVVPLGFKHHKEMQDETYMPVEPKAFNTYSQYDKSICFQEYDSARKQIGTLGGGK